MDRQVSAVSLAHAISTISAIETDICMFVVPELSFTRRYVENS